MHMVDCQEHIIISLSPTERVCELIMYNWSTTSTSSPCYRSSSSSSNIGNTTSDQPDAGFLPSASMPMSGYGDVLQEQHYCYSYSQSQVQQQEPFRRDLVGAAAAAAAPVGRYSTEERRERIDKYRAKRNQRNFQKKITYACRKTLADSRPRVKGRFARNDAAETEFTTDHHQVPDSLMNEASSSSSSSMPEPEWWPAMQQADTLAREDEELLAAYLAVSSINLY